MSPQSVLVHSMYSSAGNLSPWKPWTDSLWDTACTRITKATCLPSLWQQWHLIWTVWRIRMDYNRVNRMSLRCVLSIVLVMDRVTKRMLWLLIHVSLLNILILSFISRKSSNHMSLDDLNLLKITLNILRSTFWLVKGFFECLWEIKKDKKW